MRRDLLAVGLAIVWPTVAACCYFVLLSPSSNEPSHVSVVLPGIYAVSKIIQFCFPLGWVWLVERRPLPRLQNPTRGLTLGIGSGLGIDVGILVLYFALLRGQPFFTHAAGAMAVKLRAFGLDSIIAFVAFSVFIATFHALLEEYYWRWFVFGQLRRYMPPLWAIVLSSVAFMSHHVLILAEFFPDQWLTAVLPFSLGVAAGGALWAWLYERTGSLVGPWVSHLLTDVAIMAVGFDLLFHAGDG